MRIVFLSVYGLLLVTMTACQRPNNQHLFPAPTGSSISIASISPSTAEPLRPGAYVRLSVNAAYELTDDEGYINLLVQGADGSRLANDIEIITNGVGEATLQAEFMVPLSKDIEVFAVLQNTGQRTTSTVARQTYKVAPA